MAPSIPTHRPLFTPTRVSILVAVASVLCSVILVLNMPGEAAASALLACASGTGSR